MIPVIKASRLADAGIALHRHPRLLRGASPQPGLPDADAHQEPASGVPPGTASLPAPSPFFASVIDADAGAYATGELVHPGQYAEGHDAAFEAGRRAGWEAGHEEGLHDGVQQGRQDTDSAARVQADALAALGAAVTEACTQRRAAIEAGAIEIAWAALLRLIGQSAGERAAVADTVRCVMEQLQDRTLQSIRLSPADHALLEQGGHGLNLGAAQLVADERVEVGGCIIDTGAGSLDGRLETQLSELKAVLLELHQVHEDHGAHGAQP
jgi:flagellar assembly protein FliH